jgi:CRISPR-associated protein Cas6
VLATRQASQPIAETPLPYVELCFRVIGQTLPAEHGYGLYSSAVRPCPAIHTSNSIAIQTITGFPDKQGKIYLSDQSQLRIRLPGDHVPIIYPLAGKSLVIGGHRIQLGIPNIYMLKPHQRLRARLVVIKGFQEPEPFLEAVKRQLAALEISGQVEIPVDATGKPDRKTIKIKRFTVVGFGVEISGLNDTDSLKLQTVGLGGKHKMGAGIFVPCGREK